MKFKTRYAILGALCAFFVALGTAWPGFESDTITIPPISYIDLDLTDGYEIQFGTGLDFVCEWDTNSTGDDLFVCRNKRLAATDTAAMFFSRDLDPAAMTAFDNYLSPTFVFANDEGADANDFSAVVFGPRTTSNVAAAWYFDIFATTGAADGSANGTTTELAPIIRIGNAGTATTGHSIAAGSVLLEDKLEVDDAAYFDGLVEMFSTLQMGDAATDAGNFTMQDGAQTGDDTVVFAMSGDGAGDFSATTNDGHISLVSNDDIYLTPTGTDIITYVATNDASPEYIIGSSSAEQLEIQAVYTSGAQLLDYVLFKTTEASATADRGQYKFEVDGSEVLRIDDGGLELTGGINMSGTVVGVTTALTGTVNNALTVSVPNQGADTNAGVGITVNADDGGTGTTGGTGGDIRLTAGDGKGAGNNRGGVLRLDGGAKANAGADGYVSIGTGSPGHTPDVDSLYVAGIVEVDGMTYTDGGITSGAISSGDITISDATPVLNYKDTDAAAGDVNASIQADATDTGAGAEDIDVTFQQQVAGAATTFLVSDADGSITVGQSGQAVVVSGTVTGFTTALTGTANNALAISVPDQPDSGNAAGVGVTIQADQAGEQAGGGGAGGNLTLVAGAAGGDTGNLNGGDIVLTPGAAINSGVAGSIKPSADNTFDLGESGAEFKDLYITGTANIDALVADTADINAGTVDAITSLTASGDLDIGAHGFRANTLTADGLTSGRLVVLSTNGLLADATVTESSGALGSITTIAMGGTLTGVTTAITGTANNALNLSIPDQGANINAGVGLTVESDDGGTGTTGGAGGNITLDAGDGKGTGDNNGGDIVLGPGDKANAGADGNVLPDVDDTVSLGASATEFKDLYIDGTANIDALVADTADINGGTVDSITSLTAGGHLDIGAYGFRANTLTADGLTATRLVVAGTAGLLSDATVVESSGALSAITTLAMAGDLTDYETTNDGNPEVRVGATDAEEAHFQAVYDATSQNLDYLLISTDTADAGADEGRIIFNVDGTQIAVIDDDAIVLESTKGVTLVNNVTEFSTDGTLAGNSDSAVPTEQAVKTYADALSPVASFTMWVPVSQGGQLGQVVHGTYPVFLLDAVAEVAYFSWTVPTGYSSLTSADLVVIPTTTGTFDWTINTSWAADGEDEALATDTATADGTTSTDDQMTAVDISAAFTGIAAGDYIGIKLTLDALTTTTQINVVGIKFVMAI